MSVFKYTAVIIEPRQHTALEFVLNNFFSNLSDEWGFVIFHGRKNKNFIDNILNNKLQKYKYRVYKLIQLETDNLTINSYNAICKNTNLYKCIDTELMLFFQTDTIILNENKDIINEFLKYDYVGAPWINGVVGNGGLSLRRKSKMIEICEKVDINFTQNEDTYFSYQHVVNLNKPSFLEAQRFSVETIFHEKSFGIHATWKYLNRYELDFLIHLFIHLVF